LIREVQAGDRLPVGYVVKRLIRSWQLYIALLLGVILASTFFAGINVGADTAAKQALDQALDRVPVDLYSSIYDRLSYSNITEIVDQVSTVQEVTHVEAISRQSAEAQLPDNGKSWFRLAGISEESRTYDGWTNPPPSIGENETYVWTKSPEASRLKTGDTIQINMTVGIWRPEFQNATVESFVFSLTVAGFAELNDRASALVQGQYYSYYVGPGQSFGGQLVYTPSQAYFENLLIVDLEKTMSRVIDWMYDLNQSYISTDILMWVDRSSLISVWDIPGSLRKLNVVKSKIENQIRKSGFFSLWVYNQLESILFSAQMNVTVMRLSFIVVSLPVFFVAWYMGTTVSDVSFNLRRREIGLLLTKGFSRGQLLRMFVTEALFIGLVGGAVGMALSAALNPLFVRAVGGEFSGMPVIGVDTATLTIIFSLIITVLAVFRPARRASNLATVDALREYMYVEEVKPYRKRWPWIAFLLGTYKMIIFALGINMLVAVTGFMTSGGNFLLAILVGMWAFFDYFILTYIGPVLFFWGATKILIRGSLKFQEVTARAAKFLGDLGTMAARNVQRNPARAASVAFLIALIIGYGVQIIGTLASDQDYNVRVTYASVGADISVSLYSPANISAATELIELIRSSVPSVASTTAEYTLYGTSSYDQLQIKAVNTTEWRQTAYYEDSWFSGSDVNAAFQRLASESNTIILDRDIASRNDIKVNEVIVVSFGSEKPGSNVSMTRGLTVVGFFGTERPQSQIVVGTGGGYYSYSSYVSDRLFQEMSEFVSDSASTRILIKLDAGADKNAAAEQVRAVVPTAATVYSVAEALRQQETNFMYTGTLNVQRLGVAFAVLATSVGIGLVTLVSLKERQREASIMGVRGLSFKQLTTMLLTENLAVVAFAVLLGAVAGLIIVYGNAVAFTSTIPSLVTKRVVFPLDASLLVLAFFALVFASTILPVLFMTKRYISRLERVVRQA